jgi:hypothetical protein
MSAVYPFDTRKTTMTTQISPAQSELASPKLTPDFSHRLSPLGDQTSATQLTDSVNLLSEQAIAIVALIQQHFIGIDEVKLNDGLMFAALESVNHSIRDIRAIVCAYYDANQKEGAQ